jgi:Phage ABA sandwich domain
MNLREIDRLVAEKVMGWKLCKYGFWETEFGDLDSETEWNPTESLDDAWVILDQFDDYELYGSPFKNEYRCKVKKDDKWFSAESSESSALAICLAALKAVGVEVNNK